jgi:hypothetical protein
MEQLRYSTHAPPAHAARAPLDAGFRGLTGLNARPACSSAGRASLRSPPASRAALHARVSTLVQLGFASANLTLDGCPSKQGASATQNAVAF